MSSLTSMPAHVVLPLAAYDLGTLRKAAERADQRWIHADCSQAVDHKKCKENHSSKKRRDSGNRNAQGAS